MFVLAAEEGEGFHFPGIAEMVEWPAIGGLETSFFTLNKVVLIYFLAAAVTIGLFLWGGSKRQLVPTGIQNVMESSVDFIRNGIIMQTMGSDGLKWLPFLTTTFFFIFFCNITEIIPPLFMPATARMALPAFLAILVWMIFLAVGIMSQGAGGYFKNTMFPPGLPKGVYVLIAPIEFLSVFLIRPFSLAVRLFANLLAGHILVVTFAVLTSALFAAQWYVVFLPLPFLMLVFVMLFEVLVSFLQAYIFTLLAAVYIGGAMHPEH